MKQTKLILGIAAIFNSGIAPLLIPVDTSSNTAVNQRVLKIKKWEWLTEWNVT